MFKLKPKQLSLYTILYSKIPEDHLLKGIDNAVDFSFVNKMLEGSEGHTGTLLFRHNHDILTTRGENMSRKPREISTTGFYHIVFRGINHQHLFEEESDYQEFIQTIQQHKQEMLFEIHAYCLMSNHVHLLLKEKQYGDISLIMKRLLTKYAMYFNKKYQRSGALIASRYKSIPVEIDEYFIPLLRYIHQNPLKSGIKVKMEDYKYSSYREYLHGGKFTDTAFSLALLGKEEWLRLHQIFEEENFDVDGKFQMSEAQIRRKIMIITEGIEPHEIASWTKEKRDTILKKLKEEGLSIRQIERATGISRGIVARC